MPAWPMPDKSARAAIEGTGFGIEWATVFYVTLDGDVAIPGGVSDVNALADALGAAYGANLIASGMVSTQVQTLRIKLRLVDGASNVWRVSRSLSHQGTNANAPLGGQVCYLIDGQTHDPRRGGKARIYLPGVCENDLADQATLLPAAISSITSNANAFHNAVNAYNTGDMGHAHLVEMSFVDNKAPRVVGHGYEIFSYVCSNALATQRRRVDRRRIA